MRPDRPLPARGERPRRPLPGGRGPMVDCRSRRRRSRERGPAMSEETIFVTALEKAAPAERAAYLDAACAGDAGLRRRVEALLRAHEQSGDLLDPPPRDPGPRTEHAGDPGPSAGDRPIAG